MRVFVLGLLLTGLVFSTGCAFLRQHPPAPVADSVAEEYPHHFYREYSRRVGYSLVGDESPALLREVGQWLGTPYQMGGCSTEGTDCSCLARSIYEEVYGIQLPRRSEDMAAMAKKIPINNLKEGDLLFFNVTGKKISHVGVHISKGYFVHASSSAGVIINHITMAYYANRLAFAGRIPT